MLLRFSVENHRSIRDTQELLLTASERIRPEDRRGAVFPVPAIQEDALPAVALYGSNASGKSSVIEALCWMRNLIVNSHAEIKPMDLIPRQPFLLDHDSRTKPTRLECTFTLGHAEELSSNGKTTQEAQSIYTYGFKYTEKEICEEWLYQEAANEEQNNQLLFRRTTINKKIILQVDSQLSGENKVIERITRPNSLFLSAAAQNNHLQLLQIYRYFSTMISIEQPEFIEESSIADFLSKFGNQEEFKSILKQADIGITNVTVKEASLSKKELEIFRVLSEKIPRETLENPDSSQ